ncbi:Tn3 family transposase [Streptomyces sp. NBC_00338]|uniref:Tn3 family transposase n=1 Tax=Streptomyces sp. NBC_00338 TaxID=2975715 RepID=UPI00224DB1CD|nr:Tn3 family transposase [Streptomyces sp. NBC_00338]MCX5141873.1 Tn3 family transposase [Streptomyces sp. NBC_00338]
MPVDFLSDDQVSRFGRFAAVPSPGELEQFFRLDAQALALARGKRAPANRLGWAVQWGCVRMLGVFPTEDLSVVPAAVVRFAAEQLDVGPDELAAYGARRQNRYEHAWEIRDAYGYREFPAAEDEVRAFLAARVWASLEGPRALFDRAVVWLVDNRVLLPGITTLTRLVAEVRASESTALYRTLDEAVSEDLRQSMRDLLKVPDGKRVSELERLRTPPMRVSGTAMTAALERAKEVQGLGAHLVPTSVVPAARMSGLARYGMGSKAPTLRDLEESRKTATLLATVQHLETASVDDALDLLDVLMSSRLLSRAERVGKEEKLRSLPRLRRAAGRVAKAVGVLLETAPATDTGELVSVVDAWSAIEKVVPREKLTEALAIIAEVVPEEEGDEDAEWRAALATRYSTVRGFIRLLVDVVDFGAVQAGAPVVKALKQLPHLIGRKKIDASEVSDTLVSGSWRRLVFAAPGLEPGLADKAAYSFCVLEHLHRSLRRRDVYARRGDRWGDPRAKLLAGDRWEAAQPTVLTALGLDAEPAAHLAELAGALHGAYHQTVAGLPTNTAVSVKDGKLSLDRLGPAGEPPLMPAFRQLANGMLPKVDFPELLLEVADLTGMTSAFTHISGAEPRMEEFELSVCALLLSEACNVGLTPVVKPNVPALTRGRLVQVDQGYLRAETISAANGMLIDAQRGIDVVRAWGGGLVASADGVRFTVPVQSLHAGYSPKYFGLRHKGATWLNVVNDQVMGLGGVVVPGTLRDSLFILDALHNRDGGPKPETVITDTASYSDIVFGLFAICGYQFSPRIADIGDARLWRTHATADYGPLQDASRHTIRLDRVRAHWGDMLRVAGSLTTGEVRGYDLIRMLSRDGRPTGLGDAFAHYGRIFKTLHLLQFVSDTGYRRMIGKQLNITEARHRLARKIFFGQRGELRQHYREGMEDQLGALGLALNGVVLWNSLYLDRAAKQLAADGFPVTDDLLARLSPLQFDHINFLGRYAFFRPQEPGRRPLRDPADAEPAV